LITQQSYSFAKNTTDQTLTALQKELDKSFTSTRRKAEELSDRHEKIIKRQKVFTEQNGGYLVSSNDIITINIGGTILSVRREILTLIKGSRLEVLFSGRWENKLLRDEDGNVFLDVDPKSFKKIIDYLYMIKLSLSLSGDKPQLKTSIDEKETIGIYIDFFGLKNELNYKESLIRTPSCSSHGKGLLAKKTQENSVYEKVFNCIEKENQVLVKLEQDLDKCEKHMGEESYIESFIIRADNADNQDDGDEEDDDDDDFTMVNSSGEKSDKHNDTTMKDKRASLLKNEYANTTLNLYLNGEIMTVKRSTLCFHEDSVLAKKFSDDDWIKSQTMTLDNGKQAIVIEQPVSAFRMMVNQLRLRSMLKPDMKYHCKNNAEEVPMLKQVVSYYFPNCEDVVLGEPLDFESNILDSSDSTQIMNWLDETNETFEPHLLYRGSRDGWTHHAFHSKCNDKGPTVTIAKTKEGYVFGAYSDKSFKDAIAYESSSKAFLFSIKCHAGLPPFIMKIRPNSEYSACLHGHHYGACFGENDLHIGSMHSSMKAGLYSLGSGNYHLPDFAEPNFLTGEINSNLLDFEEVEVFAL
jgi:hypothetical protein